MLREENDTALRVNMAVVNVKVSGDFKDTARFLERIKKFDVQSVLKAYGKKGCELLSANTPVRTGETANSWSYEIEMTHEGATLSWLNSKKGSDNKTPVVFLIINGHGTRTGGYVPPNDFVSPLMNPLCEEAADAIWKVIKS